jgi:hypothetical protein
MPAFKFNRVPAPGMPTSERFQHFVTIVTAGKGIVTQIWTQNPHRNASILARSQS